MFKTLEELISVIRQRKTSPSEKSYTSKLLSDKKLSIEKLIIKKGVMIGVFIGDESNSFFKKNIFSSILNWTLSNPEKVNIKEKKTPTGLKLQIIFNNISSISKALDILNLINFSNS